MINLFRRKIKKINNENLTFDNSWVHSSYFYFLSKEERKNFNNVVPSSIKFKILESRYDVNKTINENGKLIFKKDKIRILSLLDKDLIVVNKEFDNMYTVIPGNKEIRNIEFDIDKTAPECDLGFNIEKSIRTASINIIKTHRNNPVNKRSFFYKIINDIVGDPNTNNLDIDFILIYPMHAYLYDLSCFYNKDKILTYINRSSFSGAEDSDIGYYGEGHLITVR